MGPERANLRAEMRHAYEVDKLTIKQVAAKFGRSYGTTNKLLHEAGTNVRERGGNRGRL
jgi:transposase